MASRFVRATPSKGFLVPLSLLSYVAAQQIVARAFLYRIGPTGDPYSTHYWTLVVALLVWLSGGAAGVLTFKIGDQLRLWPISIAVAAVHGLMVTFLIFLLLARAEAFNKVAIGMAAVAGLAAALGYSIFLLFV